MPSGEPPLASAARDRRYEEVSALLAEPSGPALDDVDEHGWTALHWLAGQGADPQIEQLLKRGADPTIVDEFGRDPYEVALGAGCRSAAQLLRAELLRRDPDNTSRFHWTPYCKGYLREDVERFDGWSEIVEPTVPAGTEPDREPDVLFVHDDYTVTGTVWRDQDILVATPTAGFIRFCTDELGFEVPDELDLLPTAEGD